MGTVRGAVPMLEPLCDSGINGSLQRLPRAGA